jgi:chromosome segregation ATPase
MRKHFTPAALGSALTAIVFSVGWVLDAQHERRELRESVAAQGRQLEQLAPELTRIDKQLAVMNSQMGDVAAEVNRQREWRERIEDVAETGPHGRRRNP